jgi:acetyl esterase/lipase
MGKPELSRYGRAGADGSLAMDLDTAYQNAAHIPGGAEYPARWAAAAGAFRERARPRAMLGRAYGEGARQYVDLFMPEGSPRGVLVFVHGGFWRAFGPRDWSHLAAGGLGRGWAVAMPGYTLAPAARIGAITREIAAAIGRLAAETAGPLVLTGHSAGGHLVARMACADLALEAAGRLARVVPISPLGDLRPLMQTAMNADLRLDPAEAATESPALLAPRPGLPVHVWVGGAERPAFLEQARGLAAAWGAELTVAPGRHHFDVIDPLADPTSDLMEALLGGL